jgi:hypothetical protein
LGAQAQTKGNTKLISSRSDFLYVIDLAQNGEEWKAPVSIEIKILVPCKSGI